jgi:surface polysaccharide O-acyltransferase-like enzyme
MPWAIAGGGAFSLSCAASGFAFLAIFLRFARVRGKLLDSLSANCYGIYLLHYPCVSWLQYAMLNVSIPGFLKGATVTFGALILSWVLTAGLRCSPLVRRII